MPSLIEKTEQKFKSLNLEELAKAGLIREIQSKADSHHTVTYPQRESSVLLDSTDIFNKSNKPKELSLYFHIPFCTGKCLYCNYVTNPNQSDKKVDAYLSALEKEMQLLSKTSEIKNSRVIAAYIGGGTPTFLSSSRLDKLLNNIKSNFRLSNEAEFTIETSPETILDNKGNEKLKVLKNYNVNRISLGIQTFDNQILKNMKRRHNAEQGIEAIKKIREDFDNLNIDLILGLPDSTINSLETDLKIASDLKIPSITTYPLTIKPESAISRLFEKNSCRFPNNQTYLKMHILAMEFLKQKNYFEYPTWWFISSPKYVYKQQIHKWENNGELLALGVSGYSYFNNYQYYNTMSIKDYLDFLEKDKLPIWKGSKLQTLEEQATRHLVLGIKCKINKQEFNRKYGFKPEDKFKENLTKLENLELISNTKQEIKLTDKGRLFAEEIGRSFITKE